MFIFIINFNVENVKLVQVKLVGTGRVKNKRQSLQYDSLLLKINYMRKDYLYDYLYK